MADEEEGKRCVNTACRLEAGTESVEEEEEEEEQEEAEEPEGGGALIEMVMEEPVVV